jgi:hypothetical protein
MSDQTTEHAVQKLLGKKQYEVLASEKVYYSKRVWAYDEADAETVASDEGFSLKDIYDGNFFEITDIEEVKND